MIPFDFDYYLPDTLKEATDIYAALQSEGKIPYYYGGGTEIISMSRMGSIKPDAVIDIKNIPECRGLGTDGNDLFFGAAATLSEIRESGLFPLLGLAAGRIADHTIQVRLTLGGNLAGTIYYHEALLPLLLTDSTIYITSPAKDRTVPVSQVFTMNKGLAPGELVVKVSLGRENVSLPFAHIKKTKTEKIGYPLISLCAINKGGVMRAAVSGMCSYPFRFGDLNINNEQTAAELSEQLLRQIPAPVLDNLEGSAKYREFIFIKAAENIIIKFRKNLGEI